MLNFYKKKETLISPISGKLISLNEVNDEVFSTKLMGDGFAIIPTDTKVYAPYSGIITFCFPTNHAFGLKTKDGMEILIHMGIDTVELKGKGFQSFIKPDQIVKQGEVLVEMDLDYINSKQYDTSVMIIFPNNTIVSLETSRNVEHHNSIQIELK